MDEQSASRTYNVSGMTCGHCAAAVTREVSALPGAESVEVSVEAGTLLVRGDVSAEQVRAAVDEAGYAVT